MYLLSCFNAGSWNCLDSKDLPIISLSSMAADDLAMQGATASAAMISAKYSQNI